MDGRKGKMIGIRAVKLRQEEADQNNDLKDFLQTCRTNVYETEFCPEPGPEVEITCAQQLGKEIFGERATGLLLAQSCLATFAEILLCLHLDPQT